MLRLVPDDVTLYAHDVVAGREIAGPLVRAACARHLSDLQRKDLFFDADHAEYVFGFFENVLKLSDGQFEGEPFRLHVSQKFIIGSLFGWKNATTGLRRFRRAYVEEGKGNGKSPLAAGVGLFGMLSDDEPGAQVYAAASTKDQADVVYQDAVKMAQASPRVNKRLTYTGGSHVRNMAALGGVQAGSFFRPVARTVGKTGSGPRPHIVIVDEVHEVADRGILNTLERGFKFRRQPIILMLTNSGHDRKSLCWEEREAAVNAAHGEVGYDDTFAYICGLDEGDDPLEDPLCWPKANPLLGTILTRDYIAGVVQQAKAIPGKRNNILRLHFCVWTDAETAWIPRKTWEAIEDRTMKRSDFKGKRCRIGLDLSSRKDFTAAAIAFEDGEILDSKTGQILPKFALFIDIYTPAETLKERARDDRANYELWAEQGFLKLVPGKTIRFPFIIKDIAKTQEDCDLEGVAYDRYLITRFEEDMGELGVDLPLMEHPQGWNRRKDTDLWMPGSIEQFEDLIEQGRLRVQYNPAFRAAVAGAAFLRSPTDLRRFSKADATQRIDPLIAAVQAIGAWGIVEDVKRVSVYEELAKTQTPVERYHLEAVYDEYEDDDDFR